MSSIGIALFKILKGYSSLTHPRFLTIPSYLSPAELHEFFLVQLLLNPHLQRYPPSEQYQKTFWKWAIQNLEELFSNREAGKWSSTFQLILTIGQNEEVDPRFYEHYLRLSQSHVRSIPLSEPEFPSHSYLTYYWMPRARGRDGTVNLNQLTRITLLESRTTIESGTTGLRTWKASFVLGDYLLSNPELVQGKCILELGSGVGFLGMVVAGIQQLNTHPGTCLCLTDVDERVLSRCRGNVNLSCNLSSLHRGIECRILDWSMSLTRAAPGNSLDFLPNRDFDIMLGADIVFDPLLIPALLSMLKLCLSTTVRDRLKKALIALTTRNSETMALFISKAKGRQSVQSMQSKIMTDDQDMNLRLQELEFSYHQTSFIESSSDDGPVKIFCITSE